MLRIKLWIVRRGTPEITGRVGGGGGDKEEVGNYRNVD